MTYVLVFVAVVLLLAVFQRKALGRVLAAVGAQFGKLARVFWSADPIAVYQAEVDHAASEIGDITGGLEQYRGMVSRLERQVTNGDREVARLTARVKKSLTSGNDDKAAEDVVQLKKAQADLAENTQQLSDYRTAYENNLKKIKSARSKIEAARDKARKLDADLRMSKADAEVAKLAQKFNVRSNTLDGLGEVEDEIYRQIDANKGKRAVAVDLSAEGLEDIEAEEQAQKDEAKDLLEQMKKDMGLTQVTNAQ